MATWSHANYPRNSTTWASGEGFLLTQALDYLLLETGDKIVIEPVGSYVRN